MAKRLYNPQLVKIRRSYTVGEVANLYGIHKNTVFEWIRNGLQTCDNNRPTLILGQHLRDFLIKKRRKNKITCPPGTIYCVSCKLPKKPVGSTVIYQPITETRGLLIGRCPHCFHRINRITRFSKITQFSNDAGVTVKTVKKGLSDSF